MSFFQNLNWEKWDDLALNFGLKLVFFIVALFITWLIAKKTALIIGKLGRRRRFDKTMATFLANFSKWAILGLGILFCLSIWGIQTTSLAALIAGAGLGVGLAFQSTLGNFASGLMLLTFRPFKIGDYIVVGDAGGSVVAIDLFNIVLDSIDNKRIVVPNAKVFSDKIENFSFHPQRRVDIIIGTDYSADIDHCRKALFQAIEKVTTALHHPTPVVLLVELGSSSINWSIRVWTESPDYFATKDALLRSIKYTLDAENITIPFPQMSIHLEKKN